MVHDTESPILSYNHETELSAVVNLAYLSARDVYRVEREEKAGKGFVDFIFYPEMPQVTAGIILELKVGKSPGEAIAQIQEKNYMSRFTVPMSGPIRKPDRVLLVGISYDKESKKHRCLVKNMSLK